MLYVFYGTDIEVSRKKAQTLILSLRTKRPDAAYEEIPSDNWDPSTLESHLGGQGLFSNKYIVFLNRVTDNETAEEEIEAFIPPMKKSANIFIVLEGKLKVGLKKKFTENAEKVVESGDDTAKAPTKSAEFNIFALADAVGNRDIMKSWTIYRQAVDRGLEAEGILGTLFWQAKSMVVAANAKSAPESGLNPFVYSKARKSAANYSEEERKGLLKNIVYLYHDGHRGVVDMELGVERLLLSL